MKLVLVLAVLVAGAVADDNSSEHDNFDVEALIADTEKFKLFTDCFLDKKPCNEEDKSFKMDIPEATQTACIKCTSAEKHIFKRYLEELKQKFPQEYEVFKTKYDPESKYFPALEDAVKNY